MFIKTNCSFNVISGLCNCECFYVFAFSLHCRCFSAYTYTYLQAHKILGMQLAALNFVWKMCWRCVLATSCSLFAVVSIRMKCYCTYTCFGKTDRLIWHIELYRKKAAEEWFVFWLGRLILTMLFFAVHSFMSERVCMNVSVSVLCTYLTFFHSFVRSFVRLLTSFFFASLFWVCHWQFFFRFICFFHTHSHTEN